ncbi:MAG: ABC transporter ATP-binding protein [Chloroflexi bacterium]|nr:MAG: ABC transporter ATP-binding protein [Chloroflexota bacterium]TME58163.1 MAG: ABC transporter ATP-binding protein [Chloroflexota bacterium]
MSNVVLANVGIAYDSDVVVSGLDLSISSGEWLALIGPNGAGKTTILRAIARLVAYEGDIRIGDQAVAAMSGRELARRVAMVMQEPHMPDGMSVSQYVLLGRSPHLTYFGKEGRRDHRIVADILERLSLDALAARPLDHLSGGERQRAAIARALAQQAPILLVDEPTSSLDVGRQQEVLELIDALRAEQGLTVIAAMHELTLAGQYADRLALLVGGKLVALGGPAEVLTEPAIASHYHAHVQVLSLNGSGRAVVPVRSHPPKVAP